MPKKHRLRMLGIFGSAILVACSGKGACGSTEPVNEQTPATVDAPVKSTSKKLFGNVDQLSTFCSDVGITLARKSVPGLVERVEDGSPAFLANVGRNDRILAAEMNGTKLVLNLERDGKVFRAEIETRPGLQKEKGLLDGETRTTLVPGSVKERALNAGAENNTLNAATSKIKTLITDGIGGPGGAGVPGVMGNLNNGEGWPGQPGGSGGHGDLLDGPGGVTGPGEGNYPTPYSGPREGMNGRPGQWGHGGKGAPGGLGGPGGEGNVGGPGVNELPDFNFQDRVIVGGSLVDTAIKPSQPLLKFKNELKPLKITIELGGSYINNSFNGGYVKRLLMARFADKVADAVNKYKFEPGFVHGMIVVDKQPYSTNVHVTNSFNGTNSSSFMQSTSTSINAGVADTAKAKLESAIDAKPLTLSPLTIEAFAGGSVEDSYNGRSKSLMDSLPNVKHLLAADRNDPIDWSVHAAPEPQKVLLRPTQLEIENWGILSGNCFDKSLPILHWNRPDLDYQQPDWAGALGELGRRDRPAELPQTYVAPAARSAHRAAEEQWHLERKDAKLQIRDGQRQQKEMVGLERRNASMVMEGRLQTATSKPVAGLSRPVVLRLSMGYSHVYKSFNDSGSLTALANEFLDRLSKQIRPSKLVGIDHIVFRMQGSYIENSFNDR